MPTDTTTIPRGGTDGRGRLVPLSDAELLARNQAAIEALDALGEVADETDTPEAWAEIYRGIDEARPGRRLFEGSY